MAFKSQEILQIEKDNLCMVQQEIKWKLKFIDYPQDGFTHMHISIKRNG